MTDAGLREAAALDAADPLREFRARFAIPRAAHGGEAIYFCGHSLGPQPLAAAARVRDLLDDWAMLGVRGHVEGTRPWLPYHEPFAAPLARLVGAEPAEVVAMNSLTVNLHLMLVSFYRPTAARHRILLERHAFPSDRYALASQVRFHGYDPASALLELAPREGETGLRTEDVLATLDRERERLALVLLPGVQYLSGQVLDVAAITAAARRAGVPVGWDLAHAVGNVPLRLHDWDADFAVWCSYKYLCGGPGAVAGCFVHARHAQATDLPRFAGWWGHEVATRFRMGPEFVPTPGADGWQLSNGPVLAMAPLAAALEVYDAAGMARIRAKSLALGAHARRRLTERLGARVAVLTPPGEAAGAQLSLRLPSGRDAARAAFERLTAAGVIGDWREPDVIRLAPAPLWNTYTEVARAVDTLADAIHE
ncbi:MAG: kynureninase [Steroidobacteraceae bacterium]|jgi:kynureninase|nr:kynureninase [Steroidobacteraceae bacterium]